MTIQPVRGRVYMAAFDDAGVVEKPYVVVSNNGRNNRLSDVVGVRITTTAKKEIATVIPLGPDDPLVGSVLCDTIVLIYKNELKRDVGALSRATMIKVADGLRAALSL